MNNKELIDNLNVLRMQINNLEWQVNSRGVGQDTPMKIHPDAFKKAFEGFNESNGYKPFNGYKPANPTAESVEIGGCFKLVPGRTIYMRINPSGFWNNSKLVQEKRENNGVFCVSLYSGRAFILSRAHQEIVHVKTDSIFRIMGGR
jgi:hypothetical protein